MCVKFICNIAIAEEACNKGKLSVLHGSSEGRQMETETEMATLLKTCTCNLLHKRTSRCWLLAATWGNAAIQPNEAAARNLCKSGNSFEHFSNPKRKTCTCQMIVTRPGQLARAGNKRHVGSMGQVGAKIAYPGYYCIPENLKRLPTLDNDKGDIQRGVV